LLSPEEKDIRYRYGRLASIYEYDKDHRLIDLWAACKIVRAEVGGDEDHEADKAVESVILPAHPAHAPGPADP
jgi:hypothetical protein